MQLKLLSLALARANLKAKRPSPPSSIDYVNPSINPSAVYYTDGSSKEIRSLTSLCRSLYKTFKR